MKKYMTAIVMVGMMVVPALAVDPLALDDARIKSLGDEKESARREATNALVEVGAPAIPALVKVLDADEQPAAKNAYETLFLMAGKSANTPRQAEITKALADELAADHPAATKYMLCRFLSIVGDGGAVPVLAEAMKDTDPKLREWARWALARIPGHEAVDALIAQMSQGDPTWQVAVVNALAEQANPRALPALKAQVHSADESVQIAVLHAIAQLPNSDSLSILREAVRDNRPGAIDAMLELGENLVAAGKEFDALTALVPLWNNAKLDAGQSCRVIRGLALAGSVPAMDIVLPALDHSDPQIRGAAVMACSLVHGQRERDLLARKLETAQKTTKIDVLAELGSHGRPDMLPILASLAKDKDQDVRVAAYQAMQEMKNPEAFDTLLTAFAGPPGPDREAAEVAMLRLEGESITAKMLSAYPKVNNTQKASLLWVLSHRQSPEIAPLMLKEIESSDEQVRAAAARGIGRLPDVTEKMPLAKVSAMLLTMAKKGPAVATSGAVDSLLRIATQAKVKDKAAAAEMFIETLKLAANDQQRAQSLIGIYDTVEATRTDLLDLVRPYLFKGPVRKEAAAAAAKFAINLPESRKTDAVAILKEAIEQRTANLQEALVRLHQLGVDFDPAREAGFITVWWLIGPFPNGGNKMWKKAYAPEEKVDLSAELKEDDDTLTWKRWQTLDVNGLVNLREAISSKANVGAYGYAEITVEQEQYVLFKMGSDDSIVLWLNGEKVHAKDASRGVKVDEDEAPARLRAGVNRILVKVLDKGGDWGFMVRITTPDGTPIKFKQKME